MARTKLDMGAAWSGATSLVAQNRDTVSAIAGLFFLVPYLAVGLLAPELSNPDAPEPAPGASPAEAMQMMLDQMREVYAANWPLLLGATVIQFIGSLALLALLNNRDRPSVGEALKRGAGAAPSYIAAQLLSALLAGVVVGLPLGIAAAAGAGLVGALLFPVVFLVAIYLFIKFSLLAPVIAIEGLRNPIAALQRSWRLTRGNSFRIAIFLGLLIVTIVIITILVTLVFGLVFALFDESVAMIGNAVVSSIVNTLVAVMLLMVLAAVRQQLAGPSGAELAATFE